MTRVLLGLVVALGALGCGPSVASFRPGGPCVADGRAPGTYPTLEALLPGTLAGVAPNVLDSGRSCSDGKLSTFKAHGVTDLRYAGATWTPPGGLSMVVAVFATPSSGPALDPAWVDEFYENGARASTKTENIDISHPSFDATGPVYRLDALNELSYQSVVVWPGKEFVHIVIVATELRPGGLTRADHDAAVLGAVVAAATVGAPAATGPA